ncbi:MFS quinate transporter [Saccharata proteae CBS 121410]|uniref:MFS quinate transporter n=1 Tax=Saccharata proteae CBS 121410 TaxID=1314787 RepID=A0A9P4I415_9PEZI|nr:MFS quinate transporter [Saccharata proteae CBS 121410]
MKPETLGLIRAYWLGTVLCMAGFLFGYDSGIVGGVLTLSSFENDYDYGTAQKTRVSSLSVALQQLGAFVACFLAWPMTDKLGRRKSLMICSAVFCLGAIIQTINTHSLPAFYIARVIAGLGLGAASVIVPMYISEMIPPEIRGKIGSFFQWMYTFGIFTSYWCDYGVEKAYSGNVTRQWQIPIGLQLVPAALLGLGMFTIPESTRWLMKKDRETESWQSLEWMRGGNTDAAHEEYGEISEAIRWENRETENFQLKELLERDNFSRIAMAAIVFMAQQATGATAFAVYGPQYFKLLIGDNTEKDLLLTAIFGAVKVLACGFFIFFVAERFARKTLFVGGAVFMAACQLTTAAVVKNIEPPGDGTITSAGIATVALIYMFVIAYNLSWGPLPWPYVSELFSTRIRDPGVATGVASQWLFNFIFSLTTPYMIANMGWGTFLLWGLFDILIAICSLLFLKETRGKSLEQIANAEHAFQPSRDHKVVDDPALAIPSEPARPQRVDEWTKGWDEDSVAVEERPAVDPLDDAQRPTAAET